MADNDTGEVENGFETVAEVTAQMASMASRVAAISAVASVKASR